MFITGYSEKLSVMPGESFEVRLSSEVKDLECDVVRLWHGDSNPLGPGYREDRVEQIEPKEAAGEIRGVGRGSAVRAELPAAMQGRSLSLSLLAWPTLPGNGRIQAIGAVDLAGSQLKLFIDSAGVLVASLGEDSAQVGGRLAERTWYHVTVRVDSEAIEVDAAPCNPLDGQLRSARSAHSRTDEFNPIGFVVGGSAVRPVEGSLGVAEPFNGKIENPTLSLDGQTLVDWHFEIGASTSKASDLSGHGNDGHVINMPARLMTGHNWTGEHQSPQLAPDEYGAIHFHEDDLVDVGWPVSVQFELPDSLESGIYAVRVMERGRVDTVLDRIPFVVRPTTAGETRSRVVLVLPTFTYTAYANERLVSLIDYNESGRSGYPVTLHPQDLFVAEHPEFGGSLYDEHSDGSGVCYSSLHRPIPNLRPDYRMWLQDAPRHLAADLYITGFFQHLGADLDVITDHDLHRQGSAVLADYELVLTGSHPEYYSGKMLDALQDHLDAGGSLAYLGGNGFYWVTSQDPEREFVCEVRRSQGIRSWEAAPGEYHHSTTGEPGGLWRFRGRSPNRLVGVGMCSQGWDEKAPGYQRTEASYAPEHQWVFQGIDEDVIGDFGLIMNGACGDEVDRYDVALGSPRSGVVLATSLPHSDFYQLAVEDVKMLAPGLGGSQNRDVRADMVLIEQPAGGAVFSVGAISFTGSLPWNNWDNNISRLLENVVANFQNRGTKVPPTENSKPAGSMAAQTHEGA